MAGGRPFSNKILCGSWLQPRHKDLQTACFLSAEFSPSLVLRGFDLRTSFCPRWFFVFRREEFGKYTGFKSLHFSCSLPIIVAMKIWFRIGPDQGNDQGGEQDEPRPPERYSSADPTVGFVDPFTVAGGRAFRLDCFSG